MASMVRTNREFIAIYHRHVDTVYRISFSFMKNRADAEDIVQETFLRLLSEKKNFENEKHEKAWLIVTASNLCKDALKKWWRRNENIDKLQSLGYEQTFADPAIMKAILALKPDHKTAVYMYYYEGYTTAEIAEHLNCPEATVRSRLSRARAQLRTLLGGDAR